MIDRRPEGETLVTGATGYIGGRLAATLSRAGVPIRLGGRIPISSAIGSPAPKPWSST